MTRYLLGAFAGFASVAVNAALLDFEAPLPGGLAPGSFGQDAPVLASGMITDQYADRGVIMSNVALVNLGSGHAWSGENGLSGISPAGFVDYRYDMVFRFVMPSDGATPATTDHFSVSGDRAGGSTNVVTLRGFDVDDNLLGSVSFTETGILGDMTLEGIGQFHKVEISSTLYNTYNGGIGLDMVSFGDLTAIDDASAPEPGSLLLLGAGVIALVGRRRGLFQVRVPT